MKIFTFSSYKSAAFALVAFLAVTTITFAAVAISTTQQKVKTFTATLSYHDVVSAPSYGDNPAQKTVFLMNLPADTEITSAHLKVTAPFVHADTQAISPNGSVGIYLGNTPVADITSGLDLGTAPVTSLNSGGYYSFMYPDAREVRLYVDGGGYNLEDLQSGAAKVYIDYLEH